MKKTNEFEYYNKRKNWSFNKYGIECDCLTNWDMYEILRNVTNKDSKVLDLGTGGGESVINHFPDCAEILGTDWSPNMIETANESLKESGRKNIHFEVMDNLKMTMPENYFDVVVARHTPSDPMQIRECLKDGGYLIIEGVDKADCLNLKLLFGKGQGFDNADPISIVDYKNVINAGFKDAELVPIHEREYFPNGEKLKEFLGDVPILCDFGEDQAFSKEENELLDKYIKENTHNGKVLLLRRYYGITARK